MAAVSARQARCDLEGVQGGVPASPLRRACGKVTASGGVEVGAAITVSDRASR